MPALSELERGDLETISSLRAENAEMLELLQLVSDGDIDISHTAIILGNDAKQIYFRIRQFVDLVAARAGGEG